MTALLMAQHADVLAVGQINGTVIGVAIEVSIGLGAVYALLALSFTTIFAATGYLHFALGNVVMLGTVVEFWAAARAHLPIAVALAAAVAVGTVVGYLSDQLSVRPTWGRARDTHTVVLLATLGLAYVITGVTALALGPDTYTVPPYITATPFVILGVPVMPAFVVMVAVLAILATAAQLIIRFTSIGLMLRATEESHELASLLGINVPLVVSVVFAVAGGMAALAGYLIAPVSSASAYNGLGLLIEGSAAMVIGGFGSFPGAIAGGLVVGAVSGLGPLALPASSINAAVLAVMILILLVRPQGLGLRGGARRV